MTVRRQIGKVRKKQKAPLREKACDADTLCTIKKATKGDVAAAKEIADIKEGTCK
jgi:hypothetical protein